MMNSKNNPNTPEFFDTLYSGTWKIQDFEQSFTYEEEGKKAFYQRLLTLPFFNFMGNVLDIGCGMGGVLALLDSDDISKFGIDFSEVAIEKIQKRMNGTFVVGDVHHLPFASCFFERIVCTETLEHVDHPAEAIKELARVLAPKGKALITVPDHHHDLEDHHWPGGVSLHINKYSIDSLTALVLAAGLEIELATIDTREIWMVVTKPEEQPEKRPSPGIPEVFSVETALACNLRCPECAIGGGMIDREKGFMTFEQFRIIAEKIRPYAKFLYLHIWGEPMLNRDIVPMIRLASEFCPVNISTNGLTLTPELAEELITSGVKEIIVSIDGVTQAVYEQYRVGGDVVKAFKALGLLNDLNRKHGNKVAIIPQFIVFQHNQHEAPKFKELCETVGLAPSFKAPYIRTNASRFAYSDYPNLQRPHFADVPSLQHAMRDCQNPRNVFTVLLDGTAVACCHDYKKGTSFGNIFKQDVMEIWNSPAYRKFRELVASGDAPKFCIESCMTYFLDDKKKAKHQPQLTPTGKAGAIKSGTVKKINLCSGPRKLEGYLNIDISPDADVVLDLEQDLIPIEDSTVDVLVCMSAINYFSRTRALEIIHDVHRVLKPGGVARFGTQDLRVLAAHYVNRNRDFYFEKLADGRDRYAGATFGDKLNEFFYGFYSGHNHCKYVYDFESLQQLFLEAGFTLIAEKKYRESSLGDVALIDNRPEQMFFLEAVKGGGQPQPPVTIPQIETQKSPVSGSTYSSMALKVWQAGQPERAWQYILKALECNPTDRQAFDFCEQVLTELNRLDDLAKLYRTYLERSPDEEILRRLEQNLRMPRQKDAELLEIAMRRKQLESLNERTNSIGPDDKHLAACMAWLRRAQEANGRGGVSAVYYQDKQKWEVDYPETTGYIICTFLAYARFTGDRRFAEWACAMGDWEINIQAPEGGAGEPTGVYGLRPRVFNTGQVLLGWVALYRETKDKRYLAAARRAADWMIASMDADGKWVRNTYSGQPKAYKSRVSWAILELYDVTRETQYRDAARRSIQWILQQAKPSGWFDNNSLSEPGKPWTHLTGYVQVGLLEAARLDNSGIPRKQIIDILHAGAKGIMTHYLKAKTAVRGRFMTLAATFDENWGSSDTWTCVTGTAQTEFFLRRLANFVDDPNLDKVANMLSEDLKQLHLLDGIEDPNVFGGMPGAFPVGAGYCTYSIPNWGVKFYADCLLNRLQRDDQGLCIG